MFTKIFAWLSENYLYVSAVFAAAIISCLRQIKSGRLTVSVANIGLHLVTALFFGWVMGRVAYAMGYMEPDHIAVAGAIGAYLGDGVIDLGYRFIGVERRKS